LNDLFVGESQLKLFSSTSNSLPNGALKWLPHHQLLTSLSFRLGPNGSHDTREQWINKRDLFMIAIRSLPHLQELDLDIIDTNQLLDDIPPLTIVSSSLRTLNFTMEKPSTIFDVPSLTHLDLSWYQYAPLSTKEMVVLNCKNVSHFLFEGNIGIKTSMVIPWHVFAPNMVQVSITPTGSVRFSVDHYIQMLRCPHFATLEIFHCWTEDVWSDLLLDAILHQWKYLKDLRVKRMSRQPLDDPHNIVIAQLMAFIPVDSTSMMRHQIDTSNQSTSSLSFVGERKQCIHHSLEKLATARQFLRGDWIMPSLRHFISRHQLEQCDVIWSFLSKSYPRLHTLELIDIPAAPVAPGQLKRITFPSLERLIISNSYVKWLYECINAGPYLSYIQLIILLLIHVCD
jgi:hypothetical protein